MKSVKIDGSLPMHCRHNTEDGAGDVDPTSNIPVLAFIYKVFHYFVQVFNCARVVLSLRRPLVAQ